MSYFAFLLLSLYVMKFETVIDFCFVLKSYFILPQLIVFSLDVLNVTVFVIRDRYVKTTTTKHVLKSLSFFFLSPFFLHLFFFHFHLVVIKSGLCRRCLPNG